VAEKVAKGIRQTGKMTKTLRSIVSTNQRAQMRTITLKIGVILFRKKPTPN